MDTYNNMEAKRITINQAKKVLLLKLTYIEFLRWKDPKHVIT